MMRKETENLPTTFENEESIVKHAFDTKVKARGRCRYSFSFGNFIINIQKFCKSSRVETELGVVVTAVQPPDWYEENAEEWKMKKLIDWGN